MVDFTQKQFTRVLVTSLFVYLANSVFYIFGDYGYATRYVASTLVALVNVYLLAFVLCHVVRNVRWLKSQFYLAQDSITQTFAMVVIKKTMMFTSLGLVMAIYCTLHTFLLLYPLFNNSTDSQAIHLTAFCKGLCLFTLFSITHIFHPHFFTPEFVSTQIGPVPPVLSL